MKIVIDPELSSAQKRMIRAAVVLGAVAGALGQCVEATADGRGVLSGVFADDKIHLVATFGQSAGNLGQRLLGAAAGEVGGEQGEPHRERKTYSSHPEPKSPERRFTFCFMHSKPRGSSIRQSSVDEIDS